MCVATAIYWLKPGYSKKNNVSRFGRLWRDEKRPVTLTFPTHSHTLPRKLYVHTLAHTKKHTLTAID